MARYTTLLVEAADGIATITVNRPDKLNALNATVISELGQAFGKLREDLSVRAVILTGAGDRAFIAGADIAALAGLDQAAALLNAGEGQQLTVLMESLRKPVIAAINGFALGGGLELAMACTIRIAAEGAKLGQPEVKLGLICGYGGTLRLPQIVGKGRALELLLTGEPIDAAEALRIGLVNKVVKREAVLDEARALAKKILAAGPVAVRLTLEAVEAADLGTEQSLFGQCFRTEDVREGTRAFLEKRPPKFTGK